MERDLDTQLEWVAIDHHNTDDAHVHLLVRGVRENGRPLEINRDYLRSGVRMRSQEIATRELGPRLEPEMLRSRERAVRREQWTEIDRALQRKADANGRIDYEQFQPRSESGADSRRAGARSAAVSSRRSDSRSALTNEPGSSPRITSGSYASASESQDVIKSRAHERKQRTSDRGLDRVRERRRAERWLNNVRIAFRARPSRRGSRACKAARRAFTGGSVYRDQLGDDATRGDASSVTRVGSGNRSFICGSPVYAPWAGSFGGRNGTGRRELQPLWTQCAREALLPMAVVAAVRVRRDRDGAPRLVHERVGFARLRALGDHSGSARGAPARSASDALSRGRRRATARATTGASGRNLSRRLAAMGPRVIPPRLRSHPRAGLRADAQRQGRRHRDSDAAERGRTRCWCTTSRARTGR